MNIINFSFISFLLFQIGNRFHRIPNQFPKFQIFSVRVHGISFWCIQPPSPSPGSRLSDKNLFYFMDSLGFKLSRSKTSNYAIKIVQLNLHLKENLNEKMLSHDFLIMKFGSHCQKIYRQAQSVFADNFLPKVRRTPEFGGHQYRRAVRSPCLKLRVIRRLMST